MLPVLAVAVTMLSLPHGATIDPFGSRSLMAVSENGTVAAAVTVRGYSTQAVEWGAQGRYHVMPPHSSIAGFDGTGALLVNGERPRRLAPFARLAPIDMTPCENFPQLSMGPILAGELSDGALIATMQSPPVVNLDDTSGQTAPVVLYLRSGRCLNMGNGIALGTQGLYTAGYLATIDDVPAPSNVVSAKEHVVAVRWRERTRETLGDGAAVAVADDGTTVGADGLPGLNVAFRGNVHALLWAADGAQTELAPNAPVSVAYAIDARHRVTGMLEDDRGRHYAFLWENGMLRRLDDLPNVGGWRFECGYAFAPDGSIVGIGTYRGTPKVFKLNP